MEQYMNIMNQKY